MLSSLLSFNSQYSPKTLKVSYQDPRSREVDPLETPKLRGMTQKRFSDVFWNNASSCRAEGGRLRGVALHCIVFAGESSRISKAREAKIRKAYCNSPRNENENDDVTGGSFLGFCISLFVFLYHEVEDLKLRVRFAYKSTCRLSFLFAFLSKGSLLLLENYPVSFVVPLSYSPKRVILHPDFINPTTPAQWHL